MPQTHLHRSVQLNMVSLLLPPTLPLLAHSPSTDEALCPQSSPVDEVAEAEGALLSVTEPVLHVRGVSVMWEELVSSIAVQEN